MFEINPITKDIRLTQGNAGIINTTPYKSISDDPVEFQDNDLILFTVTSPAGKVYIQKKLTAKNINDDGSFDIKILSTDTANMCPFRYKYDIVYAQYNPDLLSYEEYTFIDTAFFTIVEAQGLVNLLTPEEDINPDDSEEGEDDDG